MTKQEFLNLLEEITETEEDSLNGSESLDDLEIWDSLTIVTFIARIDELCDLTLSPEKIEKSSTVQDLMDLLEDHVTG